MRSEGERKTKRARMIERKIEKDNSRMYQKYPTKKLLRECILSLG